ncbi:SpoIIE family protein phosphatase [Actinomadura luteofluorescens]|uniref:ATP-binding SpoIIE family protein phosphatase n=1 Tax=Actinomadura luteofluorescens TaxID=46163 RepID=UPI002164E41F|nr:SpoIIE family protein phosphatase [Actinomadura glauciflava]MCR3744047.1 Serine phosphatase RsbU, regulator of sigma subunit [Actinomadura glauciflava]
MVIADLLGVTRMTAVTVNDRGRISHWDDTAADLFGAARPQALGRPPGELLRLPREHRGAFEPEAFGQVWCGACTLRRADNGEPAEIGWWIYPVEGAPGDHGVRVLALAADLRRLRRDGIGITVGDLLLAPPGVPGPAGAAALRPAAVRLLRVEPALAGPSPDGPDPFAGPFADRLAELLPALDPLVFGKIASQVLGLGCPAVSLGLTIRLPIVPHTEAAPAPAPTVPLPRPLTRAPADRPPRARRDLSHALEPLAFLGAAGEQIGSSLDHLQAARTLAEVLVPRLADLAAVELLESVVTDSAPPADEVDETTPMRRVAVAHNDEAGRWDEAVPEGEPLSVPSRTPFVQAMRTGRPVHIPRVDDARAARLAAAFGARDLRPLFTGRALLVVPLIARGRVLGTFMLLRKPDRHGFDQLDLAMVDELARRAALCVDNGRLYRREVQVAEELQRSMLPDDPPDVAGARVRYRYRPAEQAAQVGGDWFDAIPLPGCRLGIVVGDVMGHGLTSAAIMGQLRTAVRTLAAEEMRPDRLLRQLDGLARRLGEDYLATCLIAVYDPVERRCTVASAGHVPPVLRTADGESRVLPVPPGVPIGVGGEPFETVEFKVEDGSRLVLCTDGLLERRDRDLDAGLEELRAGLAESTADLDGTCDDLLDRLAGPTPADDIAIVAVGFDGIPLDDVVTWQLEAVPGSVPWIRAQVGARLADWGLHDLAETARLLVSELVTNALVHGAGSVGLRLIRGRGLLCEVHDDGADMPHLRHTEATDESGRGLQLVGHLAARWGTHRTAGGKVVWFEQRVPRR